MRKVSYTSFDYAPVDIVPVIASFDSEGHIKPLYVRINNEILKIDSCWVSSTFHNTTEFKCKVIDNNRIKPLKLTFHATESMWTIPQ